MRVGDYIFIVAAPNLVPYENYATLNRFTSALTKLVENAFSKMVESLQMFLFLFKSKYRRKFSWFSPFLCSVLIVLLFCDGVLSRCSDHNCINGVCKNDTCVCYEGWQGPECQHCGGKVKWVPWVVWFSQKFYANLPVQWPIWQTRLRDMLKTSVILREKANVGLSNYLIWLLHFLLSSLRRPRPSPTTL